MIHLSLDASHTMPIRFSSTQSSFFLVTLFSISLIYTPSCKKQYSSAALSPLVPELLEDTGTEVILPSLELFKQDITMLHQSLTELEIGFDNAAYEASLPSIQERWKSTMRIWQRLEVMQIGPIGSSLSTIGGQSYRDEIYSWPLSDHCRIDQHIVAESWMSDDFHEENTVYSYGLDALEHVLFSDLSSTCSEDLQTSEQESVKPRIFKALIE